MNGAQQAAAQNFTLTTTVIPGTPNADAEPPHVARSGDNIFTIWHEFPDANAANPQPDIFLARSVNRGQTFQPRINLSNSPAEFSAGEAIAVTRSGNSTRVYVVWLEGADLRFRRDRTNDGTFSNPITINDTLGRNAPAQLQIAASGDNVYVVWHAEQPQPGDNTDIFFARSTDAGDSFKDKKNVSNNAGVSEFPQLALADNRVIVTWRDSSAGAFDVVYARGQ